MSLKESLARRDHERGREILRVTWIGLWINVLLATGKITAGYLGNSRAVVADGVHSLSDLVTDIAVIIGVRYWLAPPDTDHPYGHKRLESLISLGIGVLLAAAGIGIAVDALSRMGRAPEARVGSFLALGASVLSIVSKEILYRWTMRKGKELKSDAVVANAWDHRSDAISSIPIAVAVAVVLWFPALFIVDLLGAVLVSGFILHAAWGICRSAVKVLLDTGAGPSVNERIIAFVSRVEGVRDVHDLRSRYQGQGLNLDMHICIDASLSVQEGNEIAHRVEDFLYSAEAAEYIGLEIFDVLVHIDPWCPELSGDVR